MKIQVSANHRHLGLDVPEIACGEHLLRCDWPHLEIDGMIGFWEFTEEFLAFKGPRIFYCCEPSFYFNGFRASKRSLRSRLASLRVDEFVWHNHSDARLRVTHPTLSGNPLCNFGLEKRSANAAAVVGNLGHPLNRNAGRQQRLKFIIDSKCDIFGSQANWERFQLWPWRKKGAPVTYRGSCESKIDTLTAYHACICLENSSEPLYFTEKFPDAVRAGCVPIYHAHPSVKREFLDGAIWIDPADYGWKSQATLDAAMRLDRAEVVAANQRWMAVHPKFQETILTQVYSRLAEILMRKAAGEICLPEQARRERLKDEY